MDWIVEIKCHFIWFLDPNMIQVLKVFPQENKNLSAVYSKNTICSDCLVVWGTPTDSSYWPGVGVTKAPFVNFSVSKIFDLANVPVMFLASHSSPDSSYWPGVGVTKAPFVNFSVSKIFDLANVPVMFLASHSYLTVVTAAELRRHLSNINVIFKI